MCFPKCDDKAMHTGCSPQRAVPSRNTGGYFSTCHSPARALLLCGLISHHCLPNARSYLGTSDPAGILPIFNCHLAGQFLSRSPEGHTPGDPAWAEVGTALRDPLASAPSPRDVLPAGDRLSRLSSPRTRRAKAQAQQTWALNAWQVLVEAASR